MKFDNMMSVVVKCINYIRSKNFQHCQLRAFLEDSDAAYAHVLYSTDVHWLSRGNFLKRFFELRTEVKTTMEEGWMALSELDDLK